MSEAEQPARKHQGQTPNPASSPKHPRRRARKRRYHVPPEALGLGFYNAPTTVNLETANWTEPPESPITESPVGPAAPAQASAAEIAEAELRLEDERKLGLSRWALWMCIAILLLIIFGRQISWLLDQAFLAWPSINGF